MGVKKVKEEFCRLLYHILIEFVVYNNYIMKFTSLVHTHYLFENMKKERWLLNKHFKTAHIFGAKIDRELYITVG